jgi:hypothetical protein
MRNRFRRTIKVRKTMMLITVEDTTFLVTLFPEIKTRGVIAVQMWSSTIHSSFCMYLLVTGHACQTYHTFTDKTFEERGVSNWGPASIQYVYSIGRNQDRREVCFVMTDSDVQLSRVVTSHPGYWRYLSFWGQEGTIVSSSRFSHI